MENIVERIRKLLRLARDKGASENEAATALAMAQKLMLQHDISNVEDEVEVKAVWDRNRVVGQGMDEIWHRSVVVSISKMFNCRHVSYGKGKFGYSFVGKPENIEVAELTFLWVCEQVEALYKEGLRTFRNQMGSLSKEVRGNFRSTFKEGCARRIQHRINEIVATARNEIPAHMALVVVDQSLAEADDLLKGVTRMRSIKWKQPGFGSGAGYNAGSQVKLRQEVKS